VELMTEKVIQNNQPRRCSIFLTPARDDYATLAGVIGEMCNRFDLPPFEPHLTIFAGSFTDPAAVERTLEAAVAGLPPLTLRVSGIGCSAEYFKTLFIEFEEDSTLRFIHERIKGEWGISPAYELHPHLSLLYADLPLREKETLARGIVLNRDLILFDRVRLVTPGNRTEGWRDTLRWESLFELRLHGKFTAPSPRVVLFDFGGVLASEGFKDGLQELARCQGLDPILVHQVGMDAIYDTGYIVGQGSEADFWRVMRQRTGLSGTDNELSSKVLSSFTVRPQMMDAVRRLRETGVVVAILSDQTDWLEILDARNGIYREFDAVFNSYRMGKGKRDPSVFADVLTRLDIRPEEALFVDDMPANVSRAMDQGLLGIVFEEEESFLRELGRVFSRQDNICAPP